MTYTYKYPRPAVTVDIMVFLEDEKKYKVLLIQRKNPPFQNMWAFPGGFIDMEETLEKAASRELEEETGIINEELIQFRTYSDPGRDPRGRTISTVFYTVLSELPKNAKAADDAADLAWFSTDKLPELAFDHKKIMRDALCEIFNKGSFS